MIIKKREFLKQFDIFKDLFKIKYFFNSSICTLKEINTNTMENTSNLMIFFKIINQFLNANNIKNIDYQNTILYIIFDKKIINQRVELILYEIKSWLNKVNNENQHYSGDQFKDDMELLLLMLNTFIDKAEIEVNIIKNEEIELSFKEDIAIKIQNEFKQIDLAINEKDYITASNKIENLYTNHFGKHFFNEKEVNKKEIINILKSKNKILEQINSIEEFNSIFSLISKVRNAIKGKKNLLMKQQN
ncbi:hypothetical protein [Spiroplasma endosymbiont of Villa modesta]|uniref:hypothetical protein n=1 Tax=Spiroplasma endosymbiont of Villa modesta TaxID=3066293 RepID=UPI00313F0891